MNAEYFDEAISFKRLYKGMKKSCCGVRWKDSVIGYEWNGLRNTLRLRRDLLNGTYKISPYTHFKIYEPKERDITATRIRDRQFQRSLCDNGLYEDMTEHFIRDNVACQRGKGTDDALNRLKVHLRRYYHKHGADGWVLKCDIHHFFPETPHDVAKATISKYVSDKRAAEAVYVIIDSFGEEKGIALGSQVSQLIELAVLNDMDHLIKERLGIKAYIRYADDFLLVHESKEHLKYCWQEIEKHLRERGLTLNKKTSLFPLRQGVHFLNWRFVLTDSGKVLMLFDEKKISEQKRKIRKLLTRELNGEIQRGEAYTSLQCWLANAERGNTYKIRNEMRLYYFRQERKMINERRVSSEKNGCPR